MQCFPHIDSRVPPGAVLENPPAPVVQPVTCRDAIQQILDDSRIKTSGLCAHMIWTALSETERTLFKGAREGQQVTELGRWLAHQSDLKVQWLRQCAVKCRCNSKPPPGITSPCQPSHKYTLAIHEPTTWNGFPQKENDQVVQEYLDLQIADPLKVEDIENGIWTLTLTASRRILLKKSRFKGKKTANQRHRLKWLEGRSCPVSKVGKKPVEGVKRVIAKMPLHRNRDRMALVLLTVKHKGAQLTETAISQNREGLGGAPCVDFLAWKQKEGRRRRGGASDDGSETQDTYQALDLYEILDVKSVFGGLYKP